MGPHGYQCPTNYLLKNNASEIRCQDPNCTGTEDNYDHCCAKQSSCRTFHCPKGYVSKSGQELEQLNCRFHTCTEDDLDRCCEEVARCDTFHNLPKGYVKRPYANEIKCASAICTNETDLEVCAVREGQDCNLRQGARALKCP